MDPLIERHMSEVQSLARAFGVERLEVFGSAITESFDPNRSDVDFIVTYPAA